MEPCASLDASVDVAWYEILLRLSDYIRIICIALIINWKNLKQILKKHFVNSFSVALFHGGLQGVQTLLSNVWSSHWQGPWFSFQYLGIAKIPKFCQDLPV